MLRIHAGILKILLGLRLGPYCTRKYSWISFRQVKEGSYLGHMKIPSKTLKRIISRYIYLAEPTLFGWIRMINHCLKSLGTTKHYELGTGRYLIQDELLEDSEKSTARLFKKFFDQYGSIPYKIVISTLDSSWEECLSRKLCSFLFL